MWVANHIIALRRGTQKNRHIFDYACDFIICLVFWTLLSEEQLCDALPHPVRKSKLVLWGDARLIKLLLTEGDGKRWALAPPFYRAPDRIGKAILWKSASCKGLPIGRMQTFQNELYAAPQARKNIIESFSSYFPIRKLQCMPRRRRFFENRVSQYRFSIRKSQRKPRFY